MRTALKIAAALALFASPAFADKLPAEWDGLIKTPSKKFDAAYLTPGANFTAYTKVMIDPTEAAFRKNWQRDFNASEIGFDNRITDDEARKMLDAAQSGLQDVFSDAYAAAGYQVVTTPGPDVLRLKTGLINLDVAAPDQMTAGRVRTYSQDAGEATLVIEARDSMSGALLGRGVDKRTIGDDAFAMRRTSVSNRADFERTFKSWAKMSVEALAALRATAAPDTQAPTQ